MAEQGSGEDRLIARHFAPLATAPGALGLNDDAALLTPPAGCEIVLEADAIVAGIHFFPDDPPDTIARKALRINLSDLAAKGARPLGFLLSLALPAGHGDDWLAPFAAALGEDAAAYGCPLFGGDTVASPGPLMVSVAAFGAVPTGTMVKRTGAHVGDIVVVTGTVGDAALGLQIRKDPAVAAGWYLAKPMREHLVDRYRVPRPRNAIAELIRTFASAAMDVSDGLAGDLAKLCAASKVSARIETKKLPLSPAAARAIAADPAALATVLSGGDDFEILATIPTERIVQFAAEATAAGVPATAIGEVTGRQAPPRIIGPDGHALLLARTSFSHF